MRIYLDSNVLIAYLREEMDSAFNLRYLEAGRFFTHCCNKKIILVISDLFLDEVNHVIGLNENDIYDTFKQLEIFFEHISNEPSQRGDIISKQTGIHFTDARHVANALASHCDAVVSFNRKDFIKTKHLISFMMPEEFISLNF